jgi:hypothetical protein
MQLPESAQAQGEELPHIVEPLTAREPGLWMLAAELGTANRTQGADRARRLGLIP